MSKMCRVKLNRRKNFSGGGFISYGRIVARRNFCSADFRRPKFFDGDLFRRLESLGIGLKVQVREYCWLSKVISVYYETLSEGPKPNKLYMEPRLRRTFSELKTS